MLFGGFQVFDFSQVVLDNLLVVAYFASHHFLLGSLLLSVFGLKQHLFLSLFLFLGKIDVY